MKKVMFVFGTRPEAIKMAPLVKEFQKNKEQFDVKVCVTAQHREMLDQVLAFFEITPDYDLDLMKKNQSLSELSARILLNMTEVFDSFTPDYVFVHGDTTTSTIVALSAFYKQIKIVHVEAGLRTHDKYSPFPEEINRQITGRLANIHLAPTIGSKENLLKENIDENTILVTGNTVIDSLLYAVERVEGFEDNQIEFLKENINIDKKIILVTGHRRENFGGGFENICYGIKEIAKEHPNVEIVYPVHLNPSVKVPVETILKGIENVKLIPPLSYPSFVWLMKKSYLVLTDSGGIQEEAPSLGKPVLVMRNTTERPEAVDVGTVILVGTDKEKIVREVNLLLKNEEVFNKMTRKHNPYGDGKASIKIIDFFKHL